jgi:hypothetical protein
LQRVVEHAVPVVEQDHHVDHAEVQPQTMQLILSFPFSTHIVA